jgi:hypothetical protein
MGDMPELVEIPTLKDINGTPLVVNNSYRIKLKNDGNTEELSQFPGHNKIGVLQRVEIVDGNTPSGIFLINGKQMDFNNYIATFTPCIDLTCSMSGGRSRRRRSRRSKRSRRVAY